MTHRFQTAMNVLFPPRCLGCGGLVEADFGLCGACWRDTPFIAGLVCNACGVPLPGQVGQHEGICDDCMIRPRPWAAGRSALIYQGRARKMVLALKHGRRTEIAAPAAAWMHHAARELLDHRMLIAPIPLHWTRLLHRTFNQSAILAKALSDRTEIETCPDLLVRSRRTISLDKKNRG